MEDISPRIAKGNHCKQPLRVRPSRRGGEDNWGMATSGVIAEGD